MSLPKLKLRVPKNEFAIHRLRPDDVILESVLKAESFWLGKTEDELSIVCDSNVELESREINNGWAGFKVLDPLDLGAVGILSGLSSALADAGFSIFVISTFDTDYILVKSVELEKATSVLQRAGYEVQNSNLTDRSNRRGPQGLAVGARALVQAW